MENTNIEAVASLRHHRGSARKVRLVLDMIRGREVKQAQRILKLSTKKLSRDLDKLLKSAVANATQKGGKIDTEQMVVDKAWANEAVIHRRYMPSIKGSAVPIRKRTCHITIGISSKQ